MNKPPLNPAVQYSYMPCYRDGETNYCPGCRRSQWIIGRTVAECAFCTYALPLEVSFSKESSKPVIIRTGKGGGKVQ